MLLYPPRYQVIRVSLRPYLGPFFRIADCEVARHQPRGFGRPCSHLPPFPYRGLATILLWMVHLPTPAESSTCPWPELFFSRYSRALF